MKTAIIIPARVASVRLERKVFSDIHGKPMITRVYEQAHKTGLGPVYVACCSQEIADTVDNAGGKGILTDPKIPSGSHRVFEASKTLDEDFDIIVNVQGDLPLIDPSIIQKIVRCFDVMDIDVATAIYPIHKKEDLLSPNTVKAIYVPLREQQDFGQVLYFSRSPIPYKKEVMESDARLPEGYYGHVGVYAYKRAALHRFANASISPLAVYENLEQLSGLAIGMRFGACVVDHSPLSVDTYEDLERVRAAYKG